MVMSHVLLCVKTFRQDENRRQQQQKQQQQQQQQQIATTTATTTATTATRLLLTKQIDHYHKSCISDHRHDTQLEKHNTSAYCHDRISTYK